MNRFSDLLAIDSSIRLAIRLGVIHDNGYPTASLTVNDDVIRYQPLMDTVEHVVELPLLDPIKIEITMLDKQYSQHQETAVLIESVNIDGFEIVPGWTHLAEYHSERGLQGPTSYLGFNGTWKLSIPLPFYQWRHQITGQGWLLRPDP